MASFFQRLMGKGPCEVRFNEGTAVEVERGTTLMDAGKKAEVEIDSYCGGTCSCGGGR